MNTDRERLQALSHTVLIELFNGNEQISREVLHVLREEFGWKGVAYGIFSWMQIAKTALALDTDAEDPLVSLHLIDPATGTFRSVHESSASPSVIIAMQTLTAFLGNQHQTANALLVSGIQRGHGGAIAWHLLTVCLGASRGYLEDNRHLIKKVETL